MTDRTRRLIAYVAGRMILEKDAETIVDVETGMTTQFEGEVGRPGADLTDLEEQSSIRVTQDGRAYLLKDEHRGVSVRFFVNENRFYGWDLDSETPFFGSANDEGIVMGEPKDKARHRYLI